MGDTNRYFDMSVREALKLVKDRFILLPDIQREYVWNMSDIEQMFESIVDGYPIGSCIFWKTNKKTLNEERPNLYYFIRDFARGKHIIEEAPEVLLDEGDYYIVLDGQQRITSLNIALFGSYTCYKGGRGYRWDNPDNWIHRELYYNLEYYELNSDEDRDDEKPPKRFVFLSCDEAVKGQYYKVKSLMAYDDTNALLRELIAEDYSIEIQDDLTRLHSKIVNSGDEGVIHYYCINRDTYDEALDIFVRVNSTGIKLSKSDLLFSTLINGWKDGKKKVDNFLLSINSRGERFEFTRDYLMRLMLVLVDSPTNLKIESFDRKTVQKIRDNWDRIVTALSNTVDMLADIGMSGGYLTSYNATMPLVYYAYNGGSFKSDTSRIEARKFLIISMANRLFGIASNDALRKTRLALQNCDCIHNSFSLSFFEDVNLTGNRVFFAKEEDVDFWLDNYEIGQNTYTILTLLYPDLKLHQVAYHQDHCHPFASFDAKHLRELGVSEDKIVEWRYKRNLLPNLQFLEGRENESKNMTPLKEWMANGKTIKYLPDDVPLDLECFDEFFDGRRQIIKTKLMELFEIV